MPASGYDEADSAGPASGFRRDARNDFHPGDFAGRFGPLCRLIPMVTRERSHPEPSLATDSIPRPEHPLWNDTHDKTHRVLAGAPRQPGGRGRPAKRSWFATRIITTARSSSLTLVTSGPPTRMERTINRLTVHTARDIHPRFSPDGRSIAFSSDREGNMDVYVIPTSGGAVKRLTIHSADDTVLDWTPDGKSVLFASQRGEDFMGKLYVVSLDGGMPRDAGP